MDCAENGEFYFCRLDGLWCSFLTVSSLVSGGEREERKERK